MRAFVDDMCDSCCDHITKIQVAKSKVGTTAEYVDEERFVFGSS